MISIEGVGFSDSASIPDDLFILNPSHQKMVTGKRNYSYIWTQYGIVGLLIVFFIGMTLLIGLSELVTEFRLATAPTIQTIGEVTDHRVSVGSKSTTYYLTYAFTNNEHTYSREVVVDNGEYSRMNIGNEIKVTFLATDPTVSHIGEKGIRWSELRFLIFIVGFFIIGGVIWQLIMIPKYLRMRRMRRDGQLIVGQLRGTYGEMIKRGSGKNRRTDYDVTAYYQFTNPNGRKIEGQSTFTRNDYKKKELPQAGSVAVLYVSGEDYLLL